MTSRSEVPDRQTAVEQILGYLNFSSGAQDPIFLIAMNLFFRDISREKNAENTKWRQCLVELQQELTRAHQVNPAFRDIKQAQDVLEFAVEQFVPNYLEFHSILLEHHSPDQIFTQFFVARILESVLTSYSSHDGQLDFAEVRSRFDDYIGYRPIAALESQKIEAYDKEFTRPIPIYIAGVGSANGRYQPFVDYAIHMIQSAPREILLAAQFDFDSLDEIAIDPRAYDFEHPVNKRPNYHFGQWDPHKLDISGYYRRFVIQQVTLDALASRCEEDNFEDPEVVYEAGAVLAGTILMAASICGRSPDAFDSNTSIATLLPGIARMRDRFYQWLLSTIKGIHGDRLLQEAKEKRQPFGGARQHLNGELANLRETQLETVRLSGIYAKMGYSVAAVEQTQTIQVASARIRTQIECKLTDAESMIRNGEYETAYERLLEIYELVESGIRCGAVIDPWNILGFDAQFSLFPAMENTVQDERAHYLVDIITQVFTTYSTLWSHVAARDHEELGFRIKESFEQLTDWWHKYAAHEVENVEAPNGKEIFRAAEQVAHAMNLWHKTGTENGNVAFWAEHAALFEMPRAYDLIVKALLEKEDLATSMALIMHWLSQADTVGLESSDSSFHLIVEQWAYRISQKALDDYRTGQWDVCEKSLNLIRKFMDFLEVNAESYWEVPEFSLGDETTKKKGQQADLVIEDEPDEIYGAAYEDVVYRDSTDDGIDGPIFETDDGKSDQLELEARRVENRLRFHETVARIWETFAPVFAECIHREGETAEPHPGQVWAACIESWAATSFDKVGHLHQLLFSVENLKPIKGMGDQDSMMEYDRQRFIQEGLLERIISVTVETRMAMRTLNGAVTVLAGKLQNPGLESSEILVADVFAAILKNDRCQLDAQITLLMEHLKTQPLLYVPISRNGAPSKIELVKSRQLFIRRLLEVLPRFGLIEQTFRLLNVSRAMERSHPVGNGAVTEFDDLFEIGFRAVVDCLIHAASHDDSTADQRQLLFRWLERFTESSLIIWLKHSRTLRLSVLEKIHNKEPWRELIRFIKTYGADIFTQRFLNFSNIRGIIHQGVEAWIDTAIENEQYDWKLFRELDKGISKSDAVAHLSLILEAMLENHLEYQDYNSTTTQSDQGDMLYMLIDFLRLKIGYDRISWHLRPVFWAHENLVNAGQDQVAKRWRRSLIDRIHKKANRFVRYLERLQRRYAMKMPSVANRIHEKFVKPMQIDRMKSLVRPAMDAENSKSDASFELLQHDAGQLIKKPEGSGIKVPSWLAALEDEVADLLDTSVTDKKLLELFIDSQSVSRSEVREQLNRIADIINKKRRPESE